MKTTTIKKVAEFLGELLLRALIAIILLGVFFALYANFNKIAALIIYAVISIAYIGFYGEHRWRDGILCAIGMAIICLVFYTSFSTSWKTDILLTYAGILFYTLQFESDKW